MPIENNAHYRRKFASARFHPDQLKNLDDLRRIPFLTKQEMRDHAPYGLFAAPMKDVVRVHASSGTTGNATVVGYTAERHRPLGHPHGPHHRQRRAAAPTMCMQVAYGYGLFTGGLGSHYGGEKIGATVIPISGGNTERQLMLIRDFGITCWPVPVLRAFPGGCRRAEGRSTSRTCGSGRVLRRRALDRRHAPRDREPLGIAAFDIYGLSEVIGPGVASECSEHRRPACFEDHVPGEIIDPDTRRGAAGRLPGRDRLSRR